MFLRDHLSYQIIVFLCPTGDLLRQVLLYMYLYYKQKVVILQYIFNHHDIGGIVGHHCLFKLFYIQSSIA